jgi:hypothetical protein
VLSWTSPPVNSTTSSRPRPVVQRLDLGGRAAAGPTDRMIGRLGHDGIGLIPRRGVVRGGSLLLIGRDGVAADPAGGGAMLMHPHDREVHGDQPVQLSGRVGIGLCAGQQPRSAAVGAPVGQPLIGGLLRPEPLRRLPPRGVGRYFQAIPSITCRDPAIGLRAARLGTPAEPDPVSAGRAPHRSTYKSYAPPGAGRHSQGAPKGLAGPAAWQEAWLG